MFNSITQKMHIFLVIFFLSYGVTFYFMQIFIEDLAFCSGVCRVISVVIALVVVIYDILKSPKKTAKNKKDYSSDLIDDFFIDN